LQARLETDAGPLTAFCTHWGLNSKEREGQAAELAAWIGQTSGPKIVCGDLNDRPESASVRTLLTRTGLGDAGAADNRATYPTDQPEARIDYIFHSPDLLLTAYTVIESTASDHLPIRADFGNLAPDAPV